MDEPAPAPVSVVIPCYRCGDVLPRALESIREQTWCPAEVILVDDASGGETVEALGALQQRYPAGWLRILEQPANRGPGEARNAGWEAASQPYIAFLDADDTWHPQKIAIQYGWMRKHPEVALTGHAVGRLGEAEAPRAAGPVDPPAVTFRPVSRHRLLWSNRFVTPSVMLRRDLRARFQPGKCYSEDYLLWLTIVCAGERAARSDRALAYLHKAPYGDRGLSARMGAMQKGQLDTYRRVRATCRLGPLHYRILQAWSLARFVRRLLIRGAIAAAVKRGTP